MKHYIGLDVSLKTTQICIIDEKGRIVKEKTAKTDPEDIYAAIISIENLNIEKIALETGHMCHFLTKGLEKKGLPVICVDARRAKTFLKLKYNKTDRNDAQGIAEGLRLDFFGEIFTKNSDELGPNTLLHSRRLLVDQRKQLQQAIRGHLKSYGIVMKSHDGIAFYNEVQKQLLDMNEIAATALRTLLETYKQLVCSVKELDREVKEQCKEKEKLLMTIPGIGPVTALTFTSEISNPKRFRRSRQVGAYLGMTPRQYSSGETEKMGPISKTGPTTLRSLLVEAGMVVLTRTQKWSKLKAWGMKIQKKHGTKKAAVAVGRKLGVMMHRMMLTGKDFQYTDKTEEQNTKRKAA